MYCNINYDLKICSWCLHVLNTGDEVDHFSLMYCIGWFFDHDTTEDSSYSWNTS